MGHFKVFIEFVMILLLFYALIFFGPETCRILAPQPGIKPAPPALAGKVLITGPPVKSLIFILVLISRVCQEIAQSPAQLFLLNSIIEV